MSKRTERPGSCLMVASIFSPIRGGSAVVYSTLCRYAEPGTMIALATRRNCYDGKEIEGWQEHDAKCGFPIHRIDLLRPESRPPASKTIATWRFLTVNIPLRIRVIWKVWQLIRQYGVEVICIGELASTAWLGEFFQRFFGKKMVLYIHGEEITTQYSAGSFGRMRKFHLHKADAVVAVSRFTRYALIDQMGLPPNRVCLIENGVDTVQFCPGPADAAFRARFNLSDKRIILGVGRLVLRKGFDQLIRALPIVLKKHPDVHLLIVGVGPLQDELQALAQRLNVAAHVTLAGALGNTDLLAAYRSADLFAMPNRTMPDGDTEGFGLTFLEANACGRAVIGGRAGGAIEAVDDGVSGLLVDGNDVNQIADAVMRILGDDELRRILEKGGLLHAREHSWQKSVKSFQDLCLQLQMEKNSND